MRSKIMTDEETAFFCEQLAMIMESGVPLADGLADFAAESGDDEFIKTVGSLSGFTDGSMTLSAAMDKAGNFPAYAVKTIKIGETTGRLEDVLRGLSDYYIRRSDIRMTIKSAVVHPMLLLGMMTAVVVILVMKIIPMFREIFEQFGDTSAGTAAEGIEFAARTGTAVMFVLIAVLLISVIVYILAKNPQTVQKLSEIMANMPIMRGISEAVAMANITGAVSMMTSCGIHPEETLELASGLTNNKRVSARLSDCEKMVLEGEYFAEAVKKSGLLPPVYARPLRSAYKAGSFDTAWKKISERYESECDRKITGAVSFIEPLIIGVLAVITGIILLTVMLPLAQMMTAVG